MRTTFDLDRLPAPEAAEAAVVSIGVFDGVHLGHQAILAANVARAQELQACPTVVTFRRHPKRVLLGHEPRTLTSLEHRLTLFGRHGIEHTLALSFDQELRAMPAEAFVHEVLVGRLAARAFVLGFDSKFGRDRAGTPESLAAAGLDVTVVPKVEVGGRAVSSTAIREAVELGDLEGAARMLGRPVSVLGHVVAGDRLGRRIGFPTANLDLHHQLHPPVGVYAAWAHHVDRETARDLEPPHRAVVNIGFRPTVSGEVPANPRIEVHLLGWEGDLYGEHLEVEFLARLRGERRFPDLDALRAAISRDAAEAARVLAGPPPRQG